jgi:hypothetical protein
VTNFRWIYPHDTIYQGSCQPRSYPHISGKRCVADYLIKTIKVSKTLQDSIHRRYQFGFFDFSYHFSLKKKSEFSATKGWRQ